MKIADLFVNIAVKGAKEVGTGLKGVRSGLGDVKSMSLEAKAAIFGVIYGLQNMMNKSGQLGVGMSNFAAATGLSAKSLQQWQYAARQVGVESAEVESTLRGVQNSMTNMLLGKGKPEGMTMLANTVGFDEKQARDTFYVLEQLQKFAQVVPADVAGQMIKSFGVSEGVFAAMKKNAFRPDMLAKAPTYSNSEIENLSRAQVIWGNLGNKVEMAFGRFTAKHGAGVAGDISELVDKIILLSEALVRLSEKLQIFKLIGKSIEGIALVTDILAGNDKKTGFDSSWGGLGDIFKGMMIEHEEKQKAGVEAMRQKHLSNVAAAEARKKGTGNNVTVNQNLNFQHDGKNAKQVGKSVLDANKAIYQNPALSQGN